MTRDQHRFLHIRINRYQCSQPIGMPIIRKGMSFKFIGVYAHRNRTTLPRNG